MTREEAKKLLPVIEAWAKGETIQVREYGASNGAWVDKLSHNAYFDQTVEFRIKPKPMEAWAIVSNITGDVLGWEKRNEQAAKNIASAYPDARVVTLREVTE